MEIRIQGRISTKTKGIPYEFLYEYWQYYNDAFKTQSYMFDIWEEGKEDDIKFSFILIDLVNKSDLKVIDMLAPNDYYKGKGIARGMILEAKEIFKKRIISSSNNSKVRISRSEIRRLDATRVWEKLKKEGFAGYNSENDYYYTV